MEGAPTSEAVPTSLSLTEDLQTAERMDGATRMAATEPQRTVTPDPTARHRRIMAPDLRRRAMGRLRVIAGIIPHRVTGAEPRITSPSCLRTRGRVVRTIPRRDPIQRRARASRLRAPSPAEALASLVAIRASAEAAAVRSAGAAPVHSAEAEGIHSAAEASAMLPAVEAVAIRAAGGAKQVNARTER